MHVLKVIPCYRGSVLPDQSWHACYLARHHTSRLTVTVKTPPTHSAFTI